ncbi:MAG: RNA pseudouridine synthase [Candidatus Coatesbacteria bacterium]|nr:MAG: RNA pseudouridine synthase [Candidatus Coatesbacteria bacterium]RLC42592.1 MAG: RNA pseudouridine synthase [Candidatus Coatesbacteria bacterium]
MKKTLKVPKLPQPIRTDIYLSKVTGMSRSRVKDLINDELILVDNQPVKQSHKLRGGESISITICKQKETINTTIDIPLIYIDEAIIVVNKPPFISVHTGAGEKATTLIEAVSSRYPIESGVGSKGREGIVHRLDKDTSGVMVIARTHIAYNSLIRQFSSHKVAKEYIAVVDGNLPLNEGEIKLPIARHPIHRKRMMVLPGFGRKAITKYKVKERLNDATVLIARPITGRTHQIRVHLSFLGYPIIGDTTYGRGSRYINRQALHAFSIEFTHPLSGEKSKFEAPIPEDLRELILAVRQN